MAMQVESLEVLEKADVAATQARAIVRAIEIEIAGARDTLATKHDLLALKQDVLAVKHELRQEIAELRGEMTAEIHSAVGGATRQMYMAILGQMAVMLGFAYFFATHLR